MFKFPEQHRVAGHAGKSGAFVFKKNNITFRMVASNGLGWEHVSISLDKKRSPDWEEMCMLKNIFWDEDDCVIQFHPAKKDYVDNHPNCLHLWRPIEGIFPTPPTELIGIKK